MRTIITVFCLLVMNVNLLGQSAIDLHSHFTTPEYLKVLEKHDALLDEGFPIPDWTLEDHLKFMNDAGIEKSILTLPAPQPYFGDKAETVAVIRQTNEAAAKLKAEHPDKFLFCAALPLPDVDAAIEEAIYALDVLHADGIKLATNSRGQYLGEEALDPLMKLLSDRGAVVILHPHKPDPYPKQVMGQTPLAMYEYLAETTRALANMIARNVLARYPGMKVVVPHCGSYMPLAVPRMKAIYPAVLAKQMVGEIDWDANLKCLYYDLAGAASVQTIKMMLTVTEPSHIMYGSDYPYVAAPILTMKINQLRNELKADAELAPYAEMFLKENAIKLFEK
ncbi:MAG: amidohydrolase [Bacteroidaceae bacterium]|nr:amidohydrolase [Bacteroidaceae bacterium]